MRRMDERREASVDAGYRYGAGPVGPPAVPGVGRDFDALVHVLLHRMLFFLGGQVPQDSVDGGDLKRGVCLLLD